MKAKILLQRIWEEKVHWDDPVPETLHQTWSRWRAELHLLSDTHIPRCYFPKEVNIAYKQLHGFSDASELAYGGVVYLRLVDTSGRVHTSLVIAKTKVALDPTIGTLWSATPCSATLPLSEGIRFSYGGRFCLDRQYHRP